MKRAVISCDERMIRSTATPKIGDLLMLSLTVTVKLQVPVLADGSVAVHVTVVAFEVPVELRVNAVPETGEQLTVTAPPELSEPVGFVHECVCVLDPESVLTMALAGHATVGSGMHKTQTYKRGLSEPNQRQNCLIVPMTYFRYR
jgi:hypothetical protein